MGNQSRQGDNGAGGGRWPCQNNTGRSPVAALDSQDRQIPGGSAAGQTQGSLLAAGPDDMVGLRPRIGHQIDSLLLGCDQAAAAQAGLEVEVGEAIRRCSPPFPVLARL